MRTSRLLGSYAAIAATLLGLGGSFTPAIALEIAQLFPNPVLDGIRVISPTRDFFERDREGFEEEIRLLDLGSGLSIFGDDPLTIDESLEPERWLYPLEEFEQLPETETRLILPTNELSLRQYLPSESH